MKRKQLLKTFKQFLLSTFCFGMVLGTQLIRLGLEKSYALGEENQQRLDKLKENKNPRVTFQEYLASKSNHKEI